MNVEGSKVNRVGKDVLHPDLFLDTLAYRLYVDYLSYRKMSFNEHEDHNVNRLVELDNDENYYFYESLDRHRARSNQVSELIVHHFLEIVNRKPIIVEVGAGLGDFAEVLNNKFLELDYTDYHYFPLDKSWFSAVNLLKKKFDSVVASADFLPYENESIDIVYAGEVVEHLPYDGCISFMRETKRLLRKGGKIVVTTPNYHSVPGKRDLETGLQPQTFDPDRNLYAIEHVFPFTKMSLVELLQRVGFRITSLSTNEIVTRMDGDTVIESTIFRVRDEVPEQEKDIYSREFTGNTIILEAER